MEQVLTQILSELQALREGQSRQGEDLTSLKQDVGTLKQDVGTLKQDVGTLKQDVSEIKVELCFVWEDIKKLDNRLTAQGEELVILKRLK